MFQYRLFYLTKICLGVTSKPYLTFTSFPVPSDFPINRTFFTYCT